MQWDKNNIHKILHITVFLNAIRLFLLHFRARKSRVPLLWLIYYLWLLRYASNLIDEQSMFHANAKCSPITHVTETYI